MNKSTNLTLDDNSKLLDLYFNDKNILYKM
jgi:hypothetical protein